MLMALLGILPLNSTRNQSTADEHDDAEKRGWPIIKPAQRIRVVDAARILETAASQEH